jgi:hypothetical protein
VIADHEVRHSVPVPCRRRLSLRRSACLRSTRRSHSGSRSQRRRRGCETENGLRRRRSFLDCDVVRVAAVRARVEAFSPRPRLGSWRTCRGRKLIRRTSRARRSLLRIYTDKSSAWVPRPRSGRTTSSA